MPRPPLTASGSSPVTLSLPLVGFYGDWSAADVFDTEDEENYSLYPVRPPSPMPLSWAPTLHPYRQIRRQVQRFLLR